jgi:4-diphosphocytidyl-2-C-methyl-D-erythritol kinase
VLAPAKINLTLDVLGKRADGYHEIDTIMQTVDIYDRITVEKGAVDTLTLQLSDPSLPTDERNTATKAARVFANAAGVSVDDISITVDKQIPQQAGMAGGSADGAAVIAALNDIFETKLSSAELCKIGLTVGADVPFCLTGGTCLAQNVGEILSPLPALDDCYIVLAKPEKGVSTKEAFAAFDSAASIRHLDTCSMLYAASQGNLYDICKYTKNVFEQLIEVPERVPIKSTLNRHGALAACMSGSGPTVYGIFDDESKAQSAASALKSLVKNIYITKPVKSGLVRKD